MTESHPKPESLDQITAGANAQDHAGKGKHKEPKGSILNPFYVASGAASLVAKTISSVGTAVYSLGADITSMLGYSSSIGPKAEKHEAKEPPH